MTAISMPVNTVESLGDQLLRYANIKGIHFFQQDSSDRTLTLIGNQDQGFVTLVFSVGGEISHFSLHKWFWSIPLVRWMFVLWLTYR